MLKKILHITSYPVISTNGADISAFERLVKLKTLGFETRMVSLVSARNYELFSILVNKWHRRFTAPFSEPGKLCFYYDNQLLETWFQESLAGFEQSVAQLIDDYQPDHIFIRMNDQRTWKLLQRLNRSNYIVFMTDNEFPRVLTAQPEEKNLINNTENFYTLSPFLQNNFSKEWNKPVGLEYQLIPPEKYRVSENSKEFITLINPVTVKGVQLFLGLAERFPEKNFLAAGGWNEKLREQFRMISRKFENISYHEPTDDIRDVYSKTRVLLVPSLWEEAFPRVIIESMISGIPCLASSVGGNSEALGQGGFILPVDRNAPLRFLDLWAEKLDLLEQDRELYCQYSERAVEEAEGYRDLSLRSFRSFVGSL